VNSFGGRMSLVGGVAKKMGLLNASQGVNGTLPFEKLSLENPVETGAGKKTEDR